MGKLLWTPSEKVKIESRMWAFLQYVNKRYQKNFQDYPALYEWSITKTEDFWEALWDFQDIICSRRFDKVVDDITRFPGAHWFPGAELNYTENMLRYCSGPDTAVVFRGESNIRKEYSKDQFRDQVFALATAFRKEGIKPGQIIAGYMPNLPETMIAMFAAAAVGAVWCSCATDIEPEAAVNRIGQLSPVLMVTADGYYYKGKSFDVLTHAEEVRSRIPSLKRVVVAHYAGDETTGAVKDAVLWDDYLEEAPESFEYEQLPAEHPLFVMFSSGTTGKPKCMVQSAAGLLLNQLKEVAVHSGIHEGTVLLYITTCSWMMWNWQASALGTDAKIVLYDGNPSYPDTGAIWKILEEEKVTAFGLSASYINSLKAQGFSPKNAADLSALTTISQTGSALSEEGFEFVYEEIKRDLHFNSIAGGTDINGCFGIGSPISPVYAGELQAAGLGMCIKSYDENAKPIYDVQGELVCEKPAPPMPLYFWGDEDGKRYFNAYFDVFPGVWRHGDYVIIHGNTGGITFYGRSDSVLKPSGVRIGTAEIYNQVDKLPEIEDSLAVGQNHNGDQRIVLFVLTKEGYVLDDKLKKDIKDILRKNTSPRHVPAIMVQAPDLPRTLNGKKVESAVTNILNGRSVTNREALANPESLDFFESILPSIQE